MSIRSLMLALVLMIVLLAGCAPSMGMVSVLTVDGNRIYGKVIAGSDAASDVISIQGPDGSEYSIKYKSIKTITRVGDVPRPYPPVTTQLGPDAPAEAPPK